MGILDTLVKANSGETTIESNLINNRDIGTLNDALSYLYKQNARNGVGGEIHGRTPAVGVDAIIQDWVRQQFIYRRSILQDLFVMSYQVTEIRSAITSIKRSVFRKGLGEWVPKWERQCITCKKEFMDKNQEHCDQCFLFEWMEVPYEDEFGNTQIGYTKKFITETDGSLVPSPTRVPRYQQKEYFERLVEDCNTFHQSLLDVLREFLEDILISDDGFLGLRKEYTIDRTTGEIKEFEIVEVTRLHPALMEFDIDRKDGLPERSHWLCVIHRQQEVHTGPGYCQQIVDDGYPCGTRLLPAMYRYYMRGRYRYYLKDEILHKSIFSPSKTYGYSPVLTVFEKVLTLLGIDRWYYRYFYERRIPPGLVITYTDDPESLETEIERIKMQLQEDPNTFPWIAAAARTNRGRTDFVKLGYTFEEMDSVSIRQEIRERVSMLWGLTPMYQGDAKSGGGSFARESAQTSMHQELIEWYQTAIDDGVLNELLKQLGITDYNLMLATPYGKTDQERLELDKLSLDIATGVMNVGYKPVLNRESKMLEFTYEEIDNPFGQAGGPMGGMQMPQGATPGQVTESPQPGVDEETGLPLPEVPPDAQEYEGQFEPSI